MVVSSPSTNWRLLITTLEEQGDGGIEEPKKRRRVGERGQLPGRVEVRPLGSENAEAVAGVHLGNRVFFRVSVCVYLYYPR